MIEVQSRTSCEDLIKEKDKEIGKLVDELEEQERHIKEANKEIERLHSIIKEVREYIDKGLYCEYGDFAYKVQKELLEILDKENKE